MKMWEPDYADLFVAFEKTGMMGAVVLDYERQLTNAGFVITSSELLDAIDELLWYYGGDDWESSEFIDYNPCGPDLPNRYLVRLRDLRRDV